MESSMTRYRIVTDNWNGFEVQAWRWWWPFWWQCGTANTHTSLEEAERYAELHSQGRQREMDPNRSGRIVKVL